MDILKAYALQFYGILKRERVESLYMNEFMQRPSRPAAPVAAGTHEVSRTEVKNNRKLGIGGKSQHVAAGLLMFSLAIVGIAVLALMLLNGKTAVQKENERVLDATYQAVFLDDSNGQVYFGKLEAINGDSYRLSDIYYVQVQSAIQPDSGKEATTSKISLAKLGNELHGPIDTMYINRSHVLFWENLKTSGQVVCAINDYQINKLDMKDVTKDENCGKDAATDTTSADSTAQQATQPATDDTTTNDTTNDPAQ